MIGNKMNKFLKLLTVLICIVFTVPVFAQDAKPELKTFEDSAAYIIGYQWGYGFKSDSLNFNVEVIKRGILDAMHGDESDRLFTNQETREIMNRFDSVMKEKQRRKEEAEAVEYKKKGREFLAENAKKDSVHVTESGLQYKILKEGTGDSPQENSAVKVHYHGTLIDGTVFDSSIERGEPAEFNAGGVIPGWTEALQMMKEGSKWKIFIPSDLAYGDRKIGNRIPPGSTLIFEVELLEIVE